jgi:glycosyltransferase involved in cell wall biosynthesis
MMPHELAPLRVLLLSAIGTRINPYLGLLQGGLTAAGAEVRLAERLTAADLGPDRRPDVIHLHWLDRYDLPPEIVVHGLGRGDDLPRRAARRLLEAGANAAAIYQARRWLRLRRLFRRLHAFQRAGGRVIYTVHNLAGHDGEGLADRWGAGRLIRQADALHVHDASTQEAVAARYGRRTHVCVIPHGHYLHSYPNAMDRSTARARLDLPDDAFVYVTLGLWRPYKGLEELVRAFRSLPDAGALLLLAGAPRPAAYADAVRGLAGDDQRIRLFPRFVPPDQVQLFLNAADICVLPYRQITTSGAALLAFSFGLPIIAPAIGGFPGLVEDRRGLLYDPTKRDGLARGLAAARQREWRGARAEILAWVAQFDWAAIGRELLALYRSTGAAASRPTQIHRLQTGS